MFKYYEDARKKYMGEWAHDRTTGLKGYITQVCFNSSQNIRLTIQPVDENNQKVLDAYTIDLTDSVEVSHPTHFSEAKHVTPVEYGIGMYVNHVVLNKFHESMVTGICMFHNGCVSYYIESPKGADGWVNSACLVASKKAMRTLPSTILATAGKATGGPMEKHVSQANKITS